MKMFVSRTMVFLGSRATFQTFFLLIAVDGGAGPSSGWGGGNATAVARGAVPGARLRNARGRGRPRKDGGEGGSKNGNTEPTDVVDPPTDSK